MPNAPIPFTNLPSATLLSGDELVPIVQGGTNKTVTAAQLAFLSTGTTLVASNATFAQLTVTSTATIEALTVSSNFSALNGSMDTLLLNNLGVLSTATIAALSVNSNFSVLNASVSFLDVWSSATIEALTVSSNFSTLNASIGSLTISSAISAPAATFSSLTVTSSATLAAATVSSNLSALNLTVSGSATLAAATVSSNFSAGNSSVGALTVTSSATIAGPVVVSSNITARVFTPTGSTSLGTGMFLPVANTLGFAVSSGEQFRIRPISSAVNYIYVQGAQAGFNTATIGVDGTDASIFLLLQSKGTAGTQFNLDNAGVARFSGTNVTPANGLIFFNGAAGVGPTISFTDLGGTGDGNVDGILAVRQSSAQVEALRLVSRTNTTKAAGYFNATSGFKRVSSIFGTTSATLANVTDLSVTVSSNTSYIVDAFLFTNSSNATGVKAAIGGTATVTAARYEGWLMDNSSDLGQARAAALGSTVAAVTAVTSAVIFMKGLISVANAGTLTAQFAQNVVSSNASTVNVGSYLQVWEVT